MASRPFGWGSFALRFVFALLLVFATYNPLGWSYLHWVSADIGSFNALMALAGLLLIIGWTIYLRATFRSLGVIGLVLAAALFGTICWVLIDYQLLDAGSPTVVSYMVMLVLACVMAVGISWSHVRRRLTGQVDADDVDED